MCYWMYKSGDQSRRQKHRDVVGDAEGLHDEHGHDELPHIVHHAPGDAHPGHAEPARPLQHRHDCEACKRPGQAVQDAEQITE